MRNVSHTTNATSSTQLNDTDLRTLREAVWELEGRAQMFSEQNSENGVYRQYICVKDQITTLKKILAGYNAVHGA